MIRDIKNIQKYCDILIETGLVLFILVEPIREHTATLKSLGIGIPFIAWVIKIIIRKKINWVSTSLDYPFSIFIFLSVLSAFFSVNMAASFASLKHFLLKFVLIYFIVTNNIKDRRQIKRLLFSLVVVNAYHSIAGVYNYMSGSHIDNIVGTHAISLVHNALAKLLVITIPIVAIFFSQSKGRLVPSFVSILFFLSAMTILLSLSRSGWAAFLCSVIVWSVFQNAKWTFAFFVFSFLTVLFLAPQAIQNRIYEGFQKGALKNRPAYWKAAIKMISDRPLIGFGYGSGIFMEIYPEYKPDDAMDELPSHVHNVFLSTAVESGIFALLTLFYIFTVYIKEVVLNIFLSREANDRVILIGILASVTGFLVFGLVEVMFINQDGMYFWFLCAIGMTIAGNKKLVS